MIAPLYVPTVISRKIVHYDMSSGTAVVDVSKDMQLVNGKSLYDIGDCYNKVISSACGYDCVNNDIHICCFIHIVCTFVQ